jgi:hypothetical protein
MQISIGLVLFLAALDQTVRPICRSHFIFAAHADPPRSWPLRSLPSPKSFKPRPRNTNGSERFVPSRLARHDSSYPMLSPVQAYTLAMTLQGPINGRVSDIVGRKPMLYAAIAIFTVFSALCGAAKSMTW